MKKINVAAMFVVVISFLFVSTNQVSAAGCGMDDCSLIGTESTVNDGTWTWEYKGEESDAKVVQALFSSYFRAASNGSMEDYHGLLDSLQSCKVNSHCYHELMSVIGIGEYITDGNRSGKSHVDNFNKATAVLFYLLNR